MVSDMSTSTHPDKALFENVKAPPILPVCEHIAGTPRFLEKALYIQAKAPTPFDITLDLEDGSPVSGLLNHAGDLLDCVSKHANPNSRLGLRLPHHSHAEWAPLLDELLKEVGERLLYITLPKVQTNKELLSISEEILIKEQQYNIRNPIHHSPQKSPAVKRDVDESCS